MLTPIELAISSSDARVAENLGTICTSGSMGKRLLVARKPYTTAELRQAGNCHQSGESTNLAMDEIDCAKSTRSSGRMAQPELGKVSDPQTGERIADAPRSANA